MSARITEAMRDAAANILAQADGCQYVFAKHYDLANMVLAAALSTEPGEAEGQTHRIEHDGFEGTVQGHYVTREGKRGVVLQQIGTKVVHVYGEKWLAAPLPEDTHHGR